MMDIHSLSNDLQYLLGLYKTTSFAVDNGLSWNF